jgi:hypothetical protein
MFLNLVPMTSHGMYCDPRICHSVLPMQGSQSHMELVFASSTVKTLCDVFTRELLTSSCVDFGFFFLLLLLLLFFGGTGVLIQGFMLARQAF